MDVISRYFAAVNTDDWAAMATLWHPDGELHAAGTPPRRGRDEVLGHYPAVLAGYRRHHDEPVRVIPAGDTVVVEIHFTGETTAGRRVEFDAVDVFDLTDGVITRLSSWYDTAAVARMVRRR
ncbi:MAG: DUF4440 domain-containing protein [Pseudonocardiaceae bacterium]|nr:DUF4440 domain-containing protein [Pseudonocardiaceae bacterium]